MTPKEENIIKKAQDVFRKRTHKNVKFLAETTDSDQFVFNITRYRRDLRCDVFQQPSRGARPRKWPKQAYHSEKRLLKKPYIPWPRPNSWRVHFLTIIRAIIPEEAINLESRQGRPSVHYGVISNWKRTD